MATNPPFNLLLAIRKRRLRFLGHILRMDKNRLLRRTLIAYINGGLSVPAGSLLEDCREWPLEELARLADDRSLWQRKVDNLK